MQVLGHYFTYFWGFRYILRAEGFRLEFSILSIGFSIVRGLGFRLS